MALLILIFLHLLLKNVYIPQSFLLYQLQAYLNVQEGIEKDQVILLLALIEAP